MASKLAHNYLPEFLALGFRSDKPRHVTVNVTDKCNQHCIYCEIGKGIPSDSNRSLSVPDLKWIIDEMAANGIRKLSLCGGEPLLFKGLFETIAYAGDKNIKTSVTSNGMTLHGINPDEVAMLQNTKTQINISLDSLDENIESRTRGSKSALSNALKSISRLQEANIPVTLLCAISKYNFHQLFDFVKQAVELGIRQILFQPVIYFSNYPDRKTIDEKASLNVPFERIGELMDQLRNIYKFEKQNPVSTNVYRILPWIRSYLETAAGKNGTWFFENLLGKFYCREIHAIIDIAYDGGIQPCGLARASVNIHDDRSEGLIKLWEKATEGLKKEMETEKFRNICNGCCHHFSRNMLASVIKYPWQNRRALQQMAPLIIERASSRAFKKVKQL
jgi:MoaA/NifB/PqqE/SkfB family radical SAM enzyme